jgi:hypothetical protein
MGDRAPLRVFLSYRREDAAGYAGRLYDSLASRLADADVFMDVSDIEPGVDFTVAIAEAVGSCDVMLALIGRRWLSATTVEGRRRLDDPDDYVVIETAAALERDVRVIPVLIDGARMPSAHELPERLRGLARRNAVELSTVSWHTDVEALLASLRRLSPGPVAPEPATPDRSSSAEAETDVTPAEKATARVRRPWFRRRWVWGAAGVAVATALVIAVLALTGDGSDNAGFVIQPEAGPPGTTIEVSAGPCPALPEGRRNPGIVVGLNDLEHKTRDEKDLPFHRGESWHARLRVPDDASPGRWNVWAVCYADPPGGGDENFHRYPNPGFDVTEP